MLIILFRLLSAEDRDGVGRIIMEVVDACVSVGRMVSPVVCNTSPEGFVLSEDDSLLDRSTVSYSTVICRYMYRIICIINVSLGTLLHTLA